MNADEFNARYPVGTPVLAYPSVRPEHPVAVRYRQAVEAGRARKAESDPCKRLITRTRSKAWILGHGEPVVMVDGYAGGIALTHVDPFLASDFSAESSAARNVPRNPHPLCRDFQPKPEPSEFWCATCGWNKPMHDDEHERTVIAAALKCLPETEAAR